MNIGLHEDQKGKWFQDAMTIASVKQKKKKIKKMTYAIYIECTLTSKFEKKWL